MSTWEAMAPRWEHRRELLERSTRPVSEWLVSRLDPQPGQTILELAAGAGETGFLAARRLGAGGRLITSDGEPEMVEAARRRAAELGLGNVELRVLDLERIELPGASVDGVLCRFGYVLRGESPRALGEIRRVLRPGGHFAFSVWGERERNPWMTVPVDAMARRGRLRPPSEEEARRSARRTPAAIAGMLHAAGFEEPLIEELPLPHRFADAGELWLWVSELRGPVALALAELTDAERAEIRAEIESAAALPRGGYELGGVALNVLTR
jgi:SAM-dependent methyltransferase